MDSHHSYNCAFHPEPQVRKAIPPDHKIPNVYIQSLPCTKKSRISLSEIVVETFEDCAISLNLFCLWQDYL